jgi:hypothetical protein
MDELTKLRAENAMLRTRVKTLEARPAPTTTDYEPALRVALAGIRKALDATPFCAPAVKAVATYIQQVLGESRE